MAFISHDRKRSIGGIQLLPNSNRGRARAVFVSILFLVSVGFTITSYVPYLSVVESLRLRPAVRYWPDQFLPQIHHTDDSVNNTASPPLPDHIWHSNGLLSVNSEGVHPIHELILRAEANWEKKLKKASKTLEEAVEEYERRYERAPPLGFDHWWNYVQEHDVKLPDECDQIFHDLEPYWGIDPETLQDAQSRRETQRDSWTIGKNEYETPASLVNMAVPESSVEQYIEWGTRPHLALMDELWQYVPPFRATFNPHDQPNQRVDWTWKAAALEAARRAYYLNPADLPPDVEVGWAAMCPPGSPLHDDPPSIGSWPTPQSTKTFIHAHLAAMDVCQHPQLLHLHATFLMVSNEPKPERFPSPRFSNCATNVFADIRGMGIQTNDDYVEDGIEWDEKGDNRLAWRGTPSGMSLGNRPNVTWCNSQRVRLVSMTGNSLAMGRSFENLSDVVSYLPPGTGPQEPFGDLMESRRGDLNRAMMDVGFVNRGYHCEGPVCDTIKAELAWKNYTTQEDTAQYKYLFDVDGNGWSSRFRRLMSTNSVVFKATVFPEWFLDRVQTCVHYVPVQLDYSDLYDSLAFFAGDH